MIPIWWLFIKKKIEEERKLEMHEWLVLSRTGWGQGSSLYIYIDVYEEKEIRSKV